VDGSGVGQFESWWNHCNTLRVKYQRTRGLTVT